MESILVEILWTLALICGEGSGEGRSIPDPRVSIVSIELDAGSAAVECEGESGLGKDKTRLANIDFNQFFCQKAPFLHFRNQIYKA